MTTENPQVPSGISHEPDLSRLSYAERMEHHRKALRPIAFYQGADGVASYKTRYPEAKRVFTPISAGAILPKPKEYYPAWRRLIGQWLTDHASLVRTQGQDVDWLNSELGSARFDRSRFLSTGLSVSERKHAVEVFADRGLALPDTVRTKAGVKRAAKAMKAKGRHGAKPFGKIGTRSGESLTIGQETFRVQRLKGREFVRVSLGGARRRLYLDDLLFIAEWLAGLFAGAVGETTGDPLHSLLVEYRELATLPKTGPSDPAPDTSGTSFLAELATSSTLSHRITRLVAARAPNPPSNPAPGKDPLEP